MLSIYQDDSYSIYVPIKIFSVQRLHIAFLPSSHLNLKCRDALLSQWSSKNVVYSFLLNEFSITEPISRHTISMVIKESYKYKYHPITLSVK